MPSMFYATSGEEVRLGDRVRIHRWLRPNLEGVVCHIPGLSPKNAEFDTGMKCWAIHCDNGRIWRMPYIPEHFTGQPPNHIVFLGRGSVPRAADSALDVT
jgi:hypothetical protein